MHFVAPQSDLLQNLFLAIKLSSRISVLILFLFLSWSQGELQKCEPFNKLRNTYLSL